MTRPPSIPADLWDAIPPNLRPADRRRGGRAGGPGRRPRGPAEPDLGQLLPPAVVRRPARQAGPAPDADRQDARRPARPPQGTSAGSCRPTDGSRPKPARCRRAARRWPATTRTRSSSRSSTCPSGSAHVTHHRRHRLRLPALPGRTTAAPVPRRRTGSAPGSRPRRVPRAAGAGSASGPSAGPSATSAASRSARRSVCKLETHGRRRLGTDPRRAPWRTPGARPPTSTRPAGSRARRRPGSGSR